MSIGYGLAVKTITPETYFLTQLHVLVRYLGLLVLPLAQNLDYDIPLAQSFWHGTTGLSWILLATLLGSAIAVRKRYPILCLAVVFFFLTLAPTSSVVPIEDVLFEHRLYVPAMGFFLLLALLWQRLAQGAWERWRSGTDRVCAILLLLLLLAYPIAAFRQSLELSPDLTHKQLGHVWLAKGELEQTILSWHTALQLSVQDVETC